MSEQAVQIDDIEFNDAVIPIPTNSVSIVMHVKIFQNGEIHELQAEYDTAEIREAFNLFDKTVNGDYPLYKLNEDWFCVDGEVKNNEE